MKKSLRQIIERQLKELENEIEKRQNAPQKSWLIDPLRKITSKIIMDASSDEVVYQRIEGFACFIAGQTAPEQPFRIALQKLLRRYRTERLKEPKTNGFLQVIRSANSYPIYRLEEVTALREAINNLIHHIHDRIVDKTERYFCEAQKECIAIEKAAAGTPVDACWFAYNLHLQSLGDTADDGQVAYFLLGNRIRDEYLAELKTFAVWLREECSSTSNRKRKRPGPKKSKTERQNELQIYREGDYRKKGNHQSDPESIIRDGDYKFEREQSHLAGVSKSDTSATVTENPLESTSKRVKKAYASYLYAEQNVPGNPIDRVVYDWLNENDPDWRTGALIKYDLPSFQTWLRYVRTGRNITGTQKNTPRHGRGVSGSVVNSSDI